MADSDSVNGRWKYLQPLISLLLTILWSISFFWARGVSDWMFDFNARVAVLEDFASDGDRFTEADGLKLKAWMFEQLKNNHPLHPAHAIEKQVDALFDKVFSELAAIRNADERTKRILRDLEIKVAEEGKK